MKNKFTARLCIVMSLVLVITCFAACNVKDKTDSTSTTLAPNASWESGSGYDKVVISQAELVGLVKDALGDDMPENFVGDLNTLTPEQLNKVEEHAKDEGLTVEKDDNGDTVIKKEEIPTTQASKDEIKDLFDKVSVKDPSNLSSEEFEELSQAAKDEGLIIETKPSGEVVVVKPVTTTRIITQATKPESTKREEKTTKNQTPHTTSVYIPEHVTAAPTNAPVEFKVSALSDGWITNYGNGKHTVLVDNTTTSDGGTVSVGIMATDKGSSGVIAKFDKKGNQKWSKTLSGNALVSFEEVAELTDGSIIVVGSTLATDIATPDQYKSKDTVEGIIVKYSAKGEQQWVKILGGSGGDMVYAVEPTSDGGFVAGGKTTSADGDFSGLSSHQTKAFLCKFNSNGDMSWKTNLGGKIHCAVVGIAVNPNGEIFVTMENNNKDGDFASLEGVNNGKRTAVVAKYTSGGDLVWVNNIYETGLVNMPAITYTSDGGCVVAGQYSVSAKEGNKGSFKTIYNGGTAGTYDGIIVKYKADGSRGWICPLIGFESDFITDITNISNGYAVSGYSASNTRDFQGMGMGDYDSYVYTVDIYGRTTKLHSYGGSSADNARAICSDGEKIYVCGSTNSTDGAFAGLTPAPNSDNAAGVIRCYTLS